MPLIVVIDDRPEKRRQLLSLAASVATDASVEGFATLGTAIESAAGAPPDLVVVGRTLPALNGVRAVRRFRNIPECEDVPVILLADPEERRICYRALEAGISDVLPDPPDPGELGLRARNLLAAYEQLKTLRIRADLLERGLAAKERRHRRDLKATRDSLRGIIDTVPAMVSVADRDGNFVFINQYLAAFVGRTPEEAMGAPIEEIFGSHHGERDKAANAEVFRGTGSLSGFEEEIVDSSGMVRTFLSTKSALRDDDNRAVNVITVAQDITFRKWVESELREAKDAAEAASRVKTKFLANVSHELRTPLNAIIGFAEGISDDLLGPPDLERYREYTRHISLSARHLKAIIDDILDIANLESGGLDVSEAEADPAAVAWDIVHALESAAGQAQVTLRVEGNAEVPAIRTDPNRLRQILSNLISNAIKFSPEGGEVQIELSEGADGDARIGVKDSGIGIAAEDLPLATDRFGQLAGDPMSNPIGGMGLGLPLSISLAELIGARVDIDSQKGAGTRVTLIFPAEKLVRSGRMAG
jgi:PAS domain S-box-containing protein